MRCPNCRKTSIKDVFPTHCFKLVIKIVFKTNHNGLNILLRVYQGTKIICRVLVIWGHVIEVTTTAYHIDQD